MVYLIEIFRKQSIQEEFRIVEEKPGMWHFCTCFLLLKDVVPAMKQRLKSPFDNYLGALKKQFLL
jgi:hypothetical protein